MMTVAFGDALLTLAIVTGSAPVAGSQPKSTIRWEYRTLTKDQLLNLGKKDLAGADSSEPPSPLLAVLGV